MIGDFNTVLHAHEKEGGGVFNQRAAQNFSQCIFDCNVIDFGFKGPLFTWRSGAFRERLDRALGNAQWQSLFPNSSVVNIPLLSSDHCGVWLRPEGEPHSHDHGYFKFLGSCLEHDDFPAQVKNVWRNSDPWPINISRLTNCLIHWNREVYGNIFKRKRRLLGRLEGIDQSLLAGPNERLTHLKKDLWSQYNALLDQEEAYWFQQGRSQWLRLGDRNTRYFHQKALVRRRGNKIEALLNDREEWVYAEKDIQQALVSYFQSFFRSSNSNIHALDTTCTYPQIEHADLQILADPINAEEVRCALSSMGNYKAPGPRRFAPSIF